MRCRLDSEVSAVFLFISIAKRYSVINYLNAFVYTGKNANPRTLCTNTSFRSGNSMHTNRNIIGENKLVVVHGTAKRAWKQWTWHMYVQYGKWTGNSSTVIKIVS